MAVLIFDNDPVAEARAIVSVLTLWLREQPTPTPDPDGPIPAAPPATARCTYTGDRLHTVVVSLEGD